jgi:CheY-like chemotaxis protein
VVNARDAMHEGGTVTIATRVTTLDAATAAESADLAPGPYVELSVADTGTGVAPELGNRIFEPFFTTKDVGKGTGLGLAICYGIVREAGGTIAVSSRPGEGATFRVLLPAIDVASDSLRPTADLRIPRGSETILLVEDEDAVRTLLCRVLREVGYDVLPAASGDDALVLLATAERLPDLLITDVVLPGRMGPEVAAEVRRRVPTVSVLYVSGYTERGTGPAAALDGPLLAKPFTRVSIAQKVREVLDKAVVATR